jgi:hypothetical protein
MKMYNESIRYSIGARSLRSTWYVTYILYLKHQPTNDAQVGNYLNYQRHSCTREEGLGRKQESNLRPRRRTCRAI